MPGVEFANDRSAAFKMADGGEGKNVFLDFLHQFPPQFILEGLNLRLNYRI